MKLMQHLRRTMAKAEERPPQYVSTLSSPVALLVPEGFPNDVIVSSFMKNEVIRVHGNGTMRIFAKGVYCDEKMGACHALDGPWGLAQLDDELFISSFSTDSILVFNINKPHDFLCAFGGSHVLDSPEGLEIGPNDGMLYIVSYLTNSVVVFEPRSRRFVREFASAMSGPEDLAFLPDGSLLVSQHWGNSVYMYDGQGKHVQTFSNLTVGPAFNDCFPVGVIVYSDDSFFVSCQGERNTILSVSMKEQSAHEVISARRHCRAPGGMGWLGPRQHKTTLAVLAYTSSAICVFNATQEKGRWKFVSSI